MTGRRRDVVVVGASAGGVVALRGLVAGLPADLGTAVFAVPHPPSGNRGAPAAILDRSGTLLAYVAVQDRRSRTGTQTSLRPLERMGCFVALACRYGEMAAVGAPDVPRQSPPRGHVNESAPP